MIISRLLPDLVQEHEAALGQDGSSHGDGLHDLEESDETFLGEEGSYQIMNWLIFRELSKSECDVLEDVNGLLSLWLRDMLLRARHVRGHVALVVSVREGEAWCVDLLQNGLSSNSQLSSELINGHYHLSVLSHCLSCLGSLGDAEITRPSSWSMSGGLRWACMKMPESRPTHLQ